MYMGYDIYPALQCSAGYISVHIYCRAVTARQPPRAIVSPFLKSAKKTHLGKGTTTLQTLGRSESDEARIEGTKRLRFEGEAQIEGEFVLDPSNPPTFLGLKPEKGWGVPGWGLGEPLPRTIFGILNFKSFNLVYIRMGNLEKSTFQRNPRETFKTNELNRPPCTLKALSKIGGQ